MGDRHGQVDDAPATGRQPGHELVAEGAQVHQLDQVLDRVGDIELGFLHRRQVQERCQVVPRLDVTLEGDGDVLGDGEGREDTGVLERSTQPEGGPAIGAPTGDVRAPEPDAAAVGRQEAGYQVED